MASRGKSIADTLQAVRDNHRFFKVVGKSGRGGARTYTTSRVQINGHKMIWAKDPQVVYSPATGLAGRREDIVDYLRSRADASDETADDVRRQFEADPNVITEKNKDQHMDYIQTKTLQRDRANQAAGANKVELVPRELIPDLLARAREVREQSSAAGKSSRSDIIATYLKKVEDTDKYYRIHGCTAEGLTLDGKQLRCANRSDISDKTSVFLGTTPPLDRFSVPNSYDNKRYVINFMTLYYIHTQNLKYADAHTQAKTYAEDLLSQFKKSRGRKGSPTPPRRKKSQSPGSKSRSSSTASADGADAPVPEVAASAASSAPANASRQTSPRGGRRGSPSPPAGRGGRRNKSQSRSRSQPRTQSPRRGAASRPSSPARAQRSPSPATTSPIATGRRTLRLPSRK